jgi:hypothetical protein
MQRITIKQLRKQAEYFNQRFGTPAEYWNPETRTCNAGHYSIEEGSRLYGRYWKLVQVCNDGGGQRIVLAGETARDLYYLMNAYWVGFEACRAHLYEQVGTL